jgi:endonuclease YncB( thermonuclease family)
MRTLTRFVAAVLTAAVVPACSVIASSVAHADPVATTATVLKVVDGDTVDIVDDIRGRLRIRLLGIDTLKPRSPATPWAAGVRRQASSRNRPCLGCARPSYRLTSDPEAGTDHANPGGNIGDEGHKSHNSHS